MRTPDMVFVYEGDHIVYFNDANLSPTVSVAAMPHKAPRSRRSSSSSRSSTSIYPSSDIEGGNFDHHIPSGAKSTYGKPSPRIPADDASLDGLYDEFLSHIVISGPAARDASQIPNLPLSPGDRFPPSPSQPSTPNVTEPLHIRKRSTPTPERDNRGGSRLLWRSSFPPSLLSSPVPQYSEYTQEHNGSRHEEVHTQQRASSPSPESPETPSPPLLRTPQTPPVATLAALPPVPRPLPRRPLPTRPLSRPLPNIPIPALNERRGVTAESLHLRMKSVDIPPLAKGPMPLLPNGKAAPPKPVKLFGRSTSGASRRPISYQPQPSPKEVPGGAELAMSRQGSGPSVVQRPSSDVQHNVEATCPVEAPVDEQEDTDIDDDYEDDEYGFSSPYKKPRKLSVPDTDEYSLNAPPEHTPSAPSPVTPTFPNYLPHRSSSPEKLNTSNIPPKARALLGLYDNGPLPEPPVAVEDDEEPVEQPKKGFGFFRRNHDEKNSPERRYRLGKRRQSSNPVPPPNPTRPLPELVQEYQCEIWKGQEVTTPGSGSTWDRPENFAPLEGTARKEKDQLGAPFIHAPRPKHAHSHSFSSVQSSYPASVATESLYPTSVSRKSSFEAIHDSPRSRRTHTSNKSSIDSSRSSPASKYVNIPNLTPNSKIGLHSPPPSDHKPLKPVPNFSPPKNLPTITYKHPFVARKVPDDSRVVEETSRRRAAPPPITIVPSDPSGLPTLATNGSKTSGSRHVATASGSSSRHAPTPSESHTSGSASRHVPTPSASSRPALSGRYSDTNRQRSASIISELTPWITSTPSSSSTREFPSSPVMPKFVSRVSEDPGKGGFTNRLPKSDPSYAVAASFAGRTAGKAKSEIRIGERQSPETHQEKPFTNRLPPHAARAIIAQSGLVPSDTRPAHHNPTSLAPRPRLDSISSTQSISYFEPDTPSPRIRGFRHMVTKVARR